MSASSKHRIAVLPAALADQIAAGEVVERPGSIVKELLDNAIDAGAARIELELEGGGAKAIRIVDDGRGIHRDDLELAVTRHATSKLHRPEQLIEIHTLGFRGEALASIAAVARVELRSRAEGEVVGHRLSSIPGEPPRIEPVGMPAGTQVRVEHLFANVPARRKFLRSEATEVGHCVEAVIRAALVHPDVHFRVRHQGRELLELPRSDEAGRVRAVLQRRASSCPQLQLLHFEGEREGVQLRAWFAPPSAATRQRNASFVIVRRRVVSERTLASILRQAYAEALPRGTHPVACLVVEPPRGGVDVNVHPQKSEVRFAEAQRVYAAVRELVEQNLARAPWVEAQAQAEPSGAESEGHAWARAEPSGARAALAGWSRRDGLSLSSSAREPGAGIGPGAGTGTGAGTGSGAASRGARYSLGTRAAASNPRAASHAFRGEVEQLRAQLSAQRASPGRGRTDEARTEERLPLGFHAELRAPEPRPPQPASVDAEPSPGPQLLTCLPGPIALFEYAGALLAADLRRVRAELVRRRMLAEWSAVDAGARAPAQRLLQPVVLRRRSDERARLLEFADELAQLGLELEGFGEGELIVRSVPAALPEVLDAAEVGLLLHRLLPYLSLRAGSRAQAREGLREAAVALTHSRGVDTSPRLARRWIHELLEGHEGSGELPGVRLWSPAELIGEGEG